MFLFYIIVMANRMVQVPLVYSVLPAVPLHNLLLPAYSWPIRSASASRNTTRDGLFATTKGAGIGHEWSEL